MNYNTMESSSDSSPLHLAVTKLHLEVVKVIKIRVIVMLILNVIIITTIIFRFYCPPVQIQSCGRPLVVVELHFILLLLLLICRCDQS